VRYTVNTLEPLETRRLFAGTVGYWRFENGAPDQIASGQNTIADASLNGLHGTAVGAPAYRADVAGPTTPLGAPNVLSLDLDGVSQGVIIQDSPALALTDSLTLEALIKVRATRAPGAGTQKIVMRGDDRAGLDPYQLIILDNALAFTVSDASGGMALLSAPLPGLNQWLHVAGTLDGSTGVMRLYVNGALQKATTTQFRPFGALDPALRPGVGVGALQTTVLSDLEQFNGLIDKVRISDRALASSELLVPASLRAAPASNQPSLVGQWDGTFLNTKHRIGGAATVIVRSQEGPMVSVDLIFEGATSYTGVTGTFKATPRKLVVKLADSAPQGPTTISVKLKYARFRERVGRRMVWRVDQDHLAGRYNIIEGGRRSGGVIALGRPDTDGVLSPA